MYKVYRIQRESGRVLDTTEFTDEQAAIDYARENNVQPGADLYIVKEDSR